MSDTLRGKFFNATRGMFGDNSVKYMNIELALTSTNYDDTGYGFDWGNKDKGSKLLASAILTKIGTPTIARIYTDKYTDNVIQKLTQDSWSLEAIEVAKWINSNTDYKIEIYESDNESEKNQEENLKLKCEKELEEKAKEERKAQREKEFQQKIQDKLKEKEAKAKIEEESENFQNAINNYKIKLKKYQNELEKQQTTIKKQQNEIEAYNQQIEKYKELIKLLDIPSLRKKFTTLDEIEI